MFFRKGAANGYLPKILPVFFALLFLLAVVAKPVMACSNSCPNDGGKQCASTTFGGTVYSGVETCSDYNSDGCLEWSGLNVCPTGQTCSLGACVSGPSQICVPNAKSVCKVCNAAGTAWVDDSSQCKDGKICQNDTCVATSSQICTPKAVSVCKVCNAAGTAWVDDSSQCKDGKICQNDACVVPGCAATTCAALGHTCGSWGDTCGGTLNCGTCATGQTCTNGSCTAQPVLPPTVDLKINGADGPVSVTEGGSIVISWTSSNAGSCAAFGSWSGTQPSSGLASANVISGSNTYSIVCSGAGGLATDSVVVNASSNTPVITLPSTLLVTSGSSTTLPASVENGTGQFYYSWFCSAGTLSSSTQLAPVYLAPTVSREIDVTCALSVRDDHSHSLGKSIQLKIQPPTSTNNQTTQNNQSSTRAQLLAKIAQIQALIAELQKQLAAINNNPTVATTGNGVLSVSAQVGNITQSLPFSKNTNAHGGDTLTFKVTVSNSANGTFADVILNNLLPGSFSAPQNIKINGVASTGSFSSGLDIGGFTASLSKTVTFTANLSQSAAVQSLTDTATASSGSVSAHDTATITVN